MSYATILTPIWRNLPRICAMTLPGGVYILEGVMFCKKGLEQLSKFSLVDKMKAGILCCLMLLACTPSIRAQSQCDTPYETNCVVTGCGYPGGCTYTLTLNDDTPGATIHYTVNGVTSGTLSSGQSFTVSQSAYCDNGSCYGGFEFVGSMYATAPGYTQSNSTGLSF
jgi:hypothetical protein